ncbi:MAG: acetylneuraminic acid synthetase, partial [Actinobacteria bacterium]|nr:acetylneuraminic acid synthetase [Actinomycetota bacterium]
MARSVVLGRRTMTPTSRPYIIAEIGVNHEGSVELAKKLIELAKEGGADGAKFQSYKADTLASKNSPAYWDTSKEATRSQHELFQKYDNFEPEDYAALAEHARSCD